MFRRLAPFLLFLVAGGMPGTANAYCRLSTGMPKPGPVGECVISGEPLFWARPCLSYSLVERARSVPPFEDDEAFDIRDAVGESFARWAEVGCAGVPLPISLRQTEDLALCDRPEHNRDGPNGNVIAFIEAWEARGLPLDAFGVTLVWHDKRTGEILDADMQLNEQSGTFDFCRGRCEGDGVDLENVLTHEAGHFLGLGHSDEVNASMYGESVRGEVRKRLLSRDDAAGVCEVYGALSQPTCTDADYSPRGGFSPACGVGTERGCAVARAGAVDTGGGAWLLVALFGWLRARRRGRPRVPVRGRA